MKRRMLVPCICLVLGLALGYGSARLGQTKEALETALTQQDDQAALDRISVLGAGEGAAASSCGLFVENGLNPDGLQIELTGVGDDGTPVQISLSASHADEMPEGKWFVLQGVDDLPEMTLRLWYEDAHGDTIAERTLPLSGGMRAD